MDDKAKVVQKKIVVAVTGLGTQMECPVDAHVPGPPEGCESRQILDHAALLGCMIHPHMGIPVRLRAVHAYAAIWEIPMERVGPDEYRTMLAAQQTPV